MSLYLEIKHPKMVEGEVYGVPFVVSGRALAPVTRVTARLTVESTSRSAEGIPLGFHQRRTGEMSFFRWSITFRESDVGSLPDSTVCLVVVTGYGANTSPITEERVRFTIKRRRRAVQEGTVLSPVSVGISSHGDSIDITAEKDDFTPYGDLVQHTLLSVTMNTLSCTYYYDDPVDLRFWYAEFAPLEVGTYTLQVLDSANHSDGRSGLEVTA